MVPIPWFKVDDGLPTSRKLLSIPRRMRLPALGLWTVAGAWSAGELTDGHVPAYMLEEWGATDAQATCLVNAGLWYAERDGYVFHDWDDYQPTRDEVHAKREAWKDRQRKARSKRESQEESRSDTQGDSRVESASPVPSRPVPSSSSTKKSGASRRKPETPMPDGWQPSPAHVRFAAERGVDGRHEEGQFRAWVASKDVRYRDWDAAFRGWLGRATPGRVSPSARAARTVMLATELLEVES